MNLVTAYNRAFGAAEIAHAIRSFFSTDAIKVHHNDSDDIDFGDLTVEQEQIDVASKSALPFEGERGIIYKTLDTLDLFVWKGSHVGWEEFKPYEEGAKPPHYCGILDDGSCTFSGTGDARTRLANALRALIDDTRNIENNPLMQFKDFLGVGDLLNQEKTYGLDSARHKEAVFNAFVHREHTALVQLIRFNMRGNTRSEFYTAVENLGVNAHYNAETRRVELEFTGSVNEHHPYEIRVTTRVYKIFV